MALSGERRKQIRILESYQYFATLSGATYSGVTFNVSPFGIAIFSDSLFEPNQQADIRIFIAQTDLRLQVKGEVVYCIENPAPAVKSAKYLAGIKFTEGPLEDLSLTSQKLKVSRHTPAHTITINAEAKRCYQLLCDFKRYPEWASGIEKSRILENYSDGRAKRVEFVHNFFLRRVRYLLDYVYDDENTILSWVNAGGDEDILTISGSYTFKSKGKDLTSATYQLYITLKMLPSQYLVQYVTNILMFKEMRNFKNFVEKNPG